MARRDVVLTDGMRGMLARRGAGAGRRHDGGARAVRVTVLGSGSGGNATLVEAGGARVLVDAGFSGRDLERRGRCGVDPRASTPSSSRTTTATIPAAWASWPAASACRSTSRTGRGRPARHCFTAQRTVRPYSSSEPFRVGALEVRPFLTVHDAADPVPSRAGYRNGGPSRHRHGPGPAHGGSAGRAGRLPHAGARGEPR
jgi:hypothetical protein